MEDAPGNLLEALYSMFFIRGDDYLGIPKYLEVSDHQHEVLKEVLFDATNEMLRDACIYDLRNREQDSSPEHVKLKAWKDVPTKDKKVADALGKKNITDDFRDRMRIKHSGGGCEKHRRD